MRRPFESGVSARDGVGFSRVLRLMDNLAGTLAVFSH